MVVAVGSGNLTLPGMQRNLETWDVLLGGYADVPEEHQLSRVVAEGALAFLGNLSAGIDSEAWAQRAILEAQAALEGLLPVLTGDNGVRWLDNFEEPIGEQIVEIATPVSPNRRLQFLSPFYGSNGKAARDLAELLEANRLELLFTGKTTFPVDRAHTWPEARLDTRQLAVVTTEAAKKSPRPLHAKVYRVIDDDRSLLVAGSANATMAGLWGTDNVEVCLSRAGSLDTFDALLRSASAEPQVEPERRPRWDRVPFSIDWARANDREVTVKLSAHGTPPPEIALGYVDGEQEPSKFPWASEPIRLRLPQDYDDLHPAPMRIEATADIDGKPCATRAWVSFEQWLQSSPEWRRSTRAWNRVLDKMSFGAEEEDAELLRIFSEEHSRTMILLGNRGGSRSAGGQKNPGEETDTPIPVKLLQAAANVDLRLLRHDSRDATSIRHVDAVRAAMLRVFRTLEHGDFGNGDDAGDARAGDRGAVDKHARGLPRSVREALNLFEARFCEASEALEAAPRYPDHILTYAGLCLRLTIRFRLLDDDGLAGLWHGIERMVGAMLSLRARVDAGPVLTLLKKDGARPPAEILAQYSALVALLHWKIAEGGHLDGESEAGVRASYSDDSLREALATLERFCDHRVPAPVLPAPLLQIFPKPAAELERLLADLQSREAPSQHAVWLDDAARRMAARATTFECVKQEEGWRALEVQLSALAGIEQELRKPIEVEKSDEGKMLKAAVQRPSERVTPWVEACPRCYISLGEQARQKLKQRHPVICPRGHWLLPSKAT